MLQNATFRTAFAISLSLHLFAISAGGFFHTKPLDDKNCPIEVSYLVPEISQDKIQERIIQNLPQKYDLEKKDLQQVVEKGEHYLSEEALKELEEYIQYYELIRESIKKYVSKNYTRFREEGIIEVAFTLNKNGILKNLAVDTSKSIKSPRLKTIALKSIKEASPFPPFPDSLKKKELAFAIAIIFKKE